MPEPQPIVYIALPSTTISWHTNQAGLWTRLGSEFRVGVPGRGGGHRPPETENNLTRRGGKKMPYSFVAKPLRYLNRTASFYVGMSEGVRLNGKIYASCAYERAVCMYSYQGFVTQKKKKERERRHRTPDNKVIITKTKLEACGLHVRIERKNTSCILQ